MLGEGRRRFLFMDECFASLDELTRTRLALELQDLVALDRSTVVFVTHSIPEAVLLGDRVSVMSPRPGSIVKEIAVPLDRPRTLGMMENRTFLELCRDLRSVLGLGTGGASDD